MCFSDSRSVEDGVRRDMASLERRIHALETIRQPGWHKRENSADRCGKCGMLGVYLRGTTCPA